MSAELEQVKAQAAAWQAVAEQALAILRSGKEDRWAATTGHNDVRPFEPLPWVMQAEELLGASDPADALSAYVAPLVAERDHWKQQHEILDGVYKATLKAHGSWMADEPPLVADNARLRGALEKYADPANWCERGGYVCWYCRPGEENGPDIATSALAAPAPDAVAKYRAKVRAEVIAELKKKRDLPGGPSLLWIRMISEEGK
jgi:hypothetical protein